MAQHVLNKDRKNLYVWSVKMFIAGLTALVYTQLKRPWFML